MKPSIMILVLMVFFLTAGYSTQFLPMPLQVLESIVLVGFVVLAIILLAMITKKKAYAYAGFTLFFSLALLDLIILYISTQRQEAFIFGIIACILGLVYAILAIPLSVPKQRKQKSEQKLEQKLIPLPVYREEEQPLETYNTYNAHNITHNTVYTPKTHVSTIAATKSLGKKSLRKSYVITQTSAKKAVKKAVKPTRAKKATQKSTSSKTTSKKRVTRVAYPQYGLTTLEGIGRVYARKLRKAKIRNTANLLKKGATRQGREDIAKKSGVSSKLVLRFVNMSDLLRIRGVAEEYSDLLEASGVDTVLELSKRKAENLLKKMTQVNARKNLVRTLPSLQKVKDWVKQAKKLPRVVKY